MSFLERTEEIWEYCRENWMLLVAAGLVILILLLSVWLIRLSRRDRQKPEDATAGEETPAEESPEEGITAEASGEEPGAESAEGSVDVIPTEEGQEAAAEKELAEDAAADTAETEETESADDGGDPACGFDTRQAYELLNLLKALNANVKRAEADLSAEHEEEEDEENLSEDVPSSESDMQPETDEKAEGEKLPEAEEPPGMEETEDAVKGLVEHLMQKVEKTGSAAGQKVASIELKIEKAQLTIHYAADEKREKNGLPESCIKEKDAGDAGFAGANGILTEEESIPKKFGLDNRNRARSGHLFTEEELQVKIRE